MIIIIKYPPLSFITIMLSEIVCFNFFFCKLQFISTIKNTKKVYFYTLPTKIFFSSKPMFGKLATRAFPRDPEWYSEIELNPCNICKEGREWGEEGE